MKVLIAMSGGVDSAVAALLMQQEGAECAGCTMRLFQKKNAVTDDVEDARQVAQRLSIPFHVASFEEEFRQEVIGRFIEAYEQGQTPNPCIICNRFFKFGALHALGKELGFEDIATGHYARIEQTPEGYVLKKAKDAAKDQSYVLYQLTQEQLEHVHFPLGELTKAEVRAIAEENGFLNAHKSDSQDICFIENVKYAAFIEEWTGRASEPGDFVDENGTVLGRHKGIIHYTIGQHRGLGLPTEIPLYVKEIDVEKNQVVLCESDSLFKKEVLVKGFHWISGEEPKEAVRCLGKIRYRHLEHPCTAQVVGDGEVLVQFDEAQRASTPGQACVLYDGDIVLGGGTIAK